MREGDSASRLLLFGWLLIWGTCVAIEMALQLENTNCAVAEGLFFKILKLSQHSAKFFTHFIALLRMSEKYNVTSSRRRNARLILVETANRMDNF